MTRVVVIIVAAAWVTTLIYLARMLDFGPAKPLVLLGEVAGAIVFTGFHGGTASAESAARVLSFCVNTLLWAAILSVPVWIWKRLHMNSTTGS